MRRFGAALVLLALCAGCADHGGARSYRDSRMKMGTRFDIQVVADDERSGLRAIEEAFVEIDRVEALLSEWRESSEISELNRRAGSGPVVVGPELFEVLERSIEISVRTRGAFDVTFAACGGLWSFDGQRVPEPEELRACLTLVGFERIGFDDAASTVTLPVRGMRVGISGIGKGYGVDRAAEVLEAHGIRDYVVDGGGDIRISGRNVDRGWTVGIAHPRQGGQLFGTLSIEDGAVVTSGDYMNYFERDGVRYHHILDPATGMPARNTIAVTVIAPDATAADALATGLFVLGPERGLALVEQSPGIEALFLSGDLEIARSSGFPSLE